MRDERIWEAIAVPGERDRAECETRTSRLRRLVLLRPGSTNGPRERGDPSLSGAGRREIEGLRHHWEWAERVLASPLRRALETASILCRAGEVGVDPRLRPLERGRFAGLSSEELHAADPILFEDWASGSDDAAFPFGETRQALRTRVEHALAELCSGPHASILIVSHRDVIRTIVAALAGARLPPGRPGIAELALVTRDGDDRWRLGRRSSDPAPLQSALERTGLRGDGDPWDERHVAPLELRLDPAR